MNTFHIKRDDLINIVEKIKPRQNGMVQYIVNIGSELVSKGENGVYNLDKFNEVNRNPEILFRNGSLISKKVLSNIVQRLATINKRIYKMKIYGLKHRHLVELPGFKSNISATLPWIFYEVHRNGSFNFNELFEKVEHGRITNNKFELKVQEKVTFRPDLMPILYEYDYESNTYDCVEYLLDGDKTKIMSMVSEDGSCNLMLITNYVNPDEDIIKINKIIEKYFNDL